MDIVLAVTCRRAGGGVGDGKIRKSLVVVIQIHVKGNAPLPEIAEAGGAVGMLAGSGQRRQEHAGENGDDGNHHEEFDQGKTKFLMFLHKVFTVCLLKPGF